ncbi:MAG: hypothetical protein ACKVP7_00020 [Hyphomicrobiaceae bacterium]
MLDHAREMVGSLATLAGGAGSIIVLHQCLHQIAQLVPDIELGGGELVQHQQQNRCWHAARGARLDQVLAEPGNQNVCRVVISIDGIA